MFKPGDKIQCIKGLSTYCNDRFRKLLLIDKIYTVNKIMLGCPQITINSVGEGMVLDCDLQGYFELVKD